MTKEEWLLPGAVVPVDPDTTKALVDEIKRLIGVVGGMALQARSAPVQEPVAWFKHGPYEDGEPLSVVFENPHDDVCYSPLGFIDTKAFEALVRADEREACAKVCSEWSDYTKGIAPTLAERIRARGNT